MTGEKKKPNKTTIQIVQRFRSTKRSYLADIHPDFKRKDRNYMGARSQTPLTGCEALKGYPNHLLLMSTPVTIHNHTCTASV